MITSRQFCALVMCSQSHTWFLTEVILACYNTVKSTREQCIHLPSSPGYTQTTTHLFLHFIIRSKAQWYQIILQKLDLAFCY